MHLSGEAPSSASSMTRRQALAQMPKTFAASKLSRLHEEKGMAFLLSSLKMFLATEVLQSMAMTVFVPLNSSTMHQMMYSQMSKLPSPVAASMPLRFLQFDFAGWLAEPRAESMLVVTQGGLPRTRICLWSFARFLREKEKKSALTIWTFLPASRFLHWAQ